MSSAHISQAELNDIPGTRVFTAARARQGYHLNQFAMSLMKPENRERWKADERAYLEGWKLTVGQKEAVLARDYNRLLDLGGNIYFLAKIFSTDGKSFVEAVSTMTGMPLEKYQAMMVAGGRSPEGQRSIREGPLRWRGLRRASRPATFPHLALHRDFGKTAEPYWAPAFAGYDWTRKWEAKQKPDVVILVYNDHATAFDMKIIPTFAIGCAEEFQPADEGWGPRQVPVVQGHPDLAWHIRAKPDPRRIDMTVINEMDVDHGLTVPLTMIFGAPAEWPCKVIPDRRQRRHRFHRRPAIAAGRWARAIGRAVASYGEDLNVQIWGTGGHEPSASGAARRIDQPEWDTRFLDRLSGDTQELRHIPHIEYLRETGSEGIEMVMWLIMRGALGPRARELHPSLSCARQQHGGRAYRPPARIRKRHEDCRCRRRCLWREGISMA